MNQFLLIITFPLLISKETKVFDRINNLYTQNNERGYILAEKLLKRKKSLAAPYYFKADFHLQKAEEKDRTLLNQTTSLSLAISCAIEFEKRADEKLRLKANWENKKILIEEEATHFLRLLSVSQPAKKKLILDKMKKLNTEFNFQETTVLNESTASPLPATTKNSEIKTTSYSTNVDFGKAPTGNENIASFDLNEERKMLEIINNARSKKGLSPLVIDENLSRAARYHAADLAHENYFSHATQNIENGKTVTKMGAFERIKLFYPGFANTENISGGKQRAEETYREWYKSTGHHKNMFNETATKVGIGLSYLEGSDFGYYWVFCTGN
jgi:uncharacterized protein YkwD